MLTQASIAQKLKLSQRAVGFALSDDPHSQKQLSPQTRQRIRETARQLGYVPHQAACSLRLGKTHTIALVSKTTLRSFYVHDLIEEIHVALTKRGYHLILELTHFFPDEAKVYASLAAGRCDGVIGFGPDEQNQARLKALRSRGLPVVVTHSIMRDPELDVVRADHEEMLRLGVGHLLAMGHRRIAFVGGYRGAGFDYRLALFRQILAEAGVAFDSALVFSWETEPDPADWWRQVQALGLLPTAILVHSDHVAGRMARAIRATKLRVPEDVALVATDHSIWDEVVDPPLTTVEINHKEFAQVVVERLMGQIENPHTPVRETLLHPRLFVRESSAGKQLTNHQEPEGDRES